MNWTAIIIAGALMGGLAIVFGIVLGIADKKFTVQEDGRISLVYECLGGANCGACGYAGCSALAEAIVEGKAAPNACPASGAEKVARISEIMGVSAQAKEPMIARLACMGDCESVALRYNYDGLPDCRIASGLSGGPKMCTYACIGMGDCVKACKFGAIYLSEKGLPIFIPEKCTGCGACAQQCPRGAIKLAPKSSTVMVACRNDDIAKESRANCKHGCIACKKCERVCPVGAISINGKHSQIDFAKCIKCGECAKSCPSSCIEVFDA